MGDKASGWTYLDVLAYSLPGEPVLVGGSIYHLLAKTLLNALRDDSIPLIVTDPPYGSGPKTSQRRWEREVFDEVENIGEPITDWIGDAYRVLRPNGAMYAFADWRRVVEWKRAYEVEGFEVKNILVWDKGHHTSGDLKGAYGFSYELVFFLVKGRHLLRGGRPRDLISIPRVANGEHLHQYQKPVMLLEDFILHSSDVADLVVDPFAGSGSTGKAAQRLGRRFILGDSDLRTVAKAFQWLSEPIQTALFDLTPYT